MDLSEKDIFITEKLMKLEPDTLRFMVADLTAEVERLEIKTEAMRLVLAPLSVKAGISEEKLVSLLVEAEQGMTKYVAEKASQP